MSKMTEGPWIVYPTNEDRIDLDEFELFEIQDGDQCIICESVCGADNAFAIGALPEIVKAAKPIADLVTKLEEFNTSDIGVLPVQMELLRALRSALRKGGVE